MPKRSAELIISAASAADFPASGLPEVALIGRSNVGKSTLINALVGQRIARTSAAPGKTRLANYYAIDDELFLVDLPGYGYARGGDTAALEFEKLTAQYFAIDPQSRRRIAGILHLVDARHPDLPQDATAHDWVLRTRVPVAVVATKMDKLNRTDARRHLKVLGESYDTIVLPVSATDENGLSEVWKTIHHWIR